MAKRLFLNEDPRWLPFCEAYAGSLERFAIEVQGVQPTPQQFELYRSTSPSRSRTTVASGHGCFAAGTSVMRADGECVTVESVAVGDRLMGPDGASTRNVVELKRGREAMYRFTYADGTSHVFNESHILCLVATNSKGRRVAGQKITVIVRDWLTWGEDKKRCHAVYRSGVEAFEREHAGLAIPPYIMGAWLGDGTSASSQFTTADPEIHVAVAEYAESIGCSLRIARNSENSNTLNIARRIGTHKENPMRAALRGLGVFRNKHIPDAYLFASKRDRLELLAGLIDTDGSLDNCGYDFIQKSEAMARQVAWLARSVGCHSTIKEVHKTCGNNGVKGAYWRVTIGRNTDQIPVRIARKKPAPGHRQRGNLHFSIRSCEPLGEGDYFGFVLDGDSRFLGGDFTVLHNTGKTTSIANVVLWHLLCYPQSITLLTANDMDQLKATLWKEIGIAIERIRRGRHGWIAEHVEVLANATMRIIGFEDTWFVESKTANEKTANKMAGRHGEWLLIIGDEASTLPDTVLSTLRGALTEQHNRMLLTSQPTRNAGFFWRTHHELAKDNGGEWNNLTFSSLESPLVSDDALKELWDAYDDDERRVRLMGLFPQDSSKHMMSLKVAMRMYGRNRIIKDNEPYGWVVLSDVASGEGLRDKSAVLAARVIGYGDRGLDARRVEIVEIPLMTNTIRSNRIFGPIMEVGEQLDGVTYGVDSGGLGVNVCQDLEDAGKVVHRINWGNPCFQNKNKDRYLNLRAQAMHQAARAAKEGRLVVLTNEHKNTMLAQASRIPKTFSDKGRIRVPPKHSPEWEGMASPDLWDAVCFAFLENLTYVAAQDKSGSVMTLGDRAEEAVESLFAGL
ncbi:Hint domain-containing homing endonuclease [Pseudomonas extremaustralis]